MTTQPQDASSLSRSDAGTSLIELMLALTLLVVAALVMTSSTLTATVQSEAAGAKAAAMQQTQALLEQMASRPIATLGTVFPHDQDLAPFQDQGVEGLRIRVRYRDGDADARPLFYEVETTWNGPGDAPWSKTIHGVRAR